MTMNLLPNALRKQQEKDEELGDLFAALHTFTDRTLERFFWEDEVSGNKLPKIVLSVEKDKKTRLGYYVQKDGLTLIHKINLNLSSHKNGVDLAETLAHEIVHYWMKIENKPTRHNYHTDVFHEIMKRYGIRTEGRKGTSVGYIGTTWKEWLLENSDLKLKEFKFKNKLKDAKPPRPMIKHACPGCDVSFRRRTPVNVKCLDCDLKFEIVA